MGFNWLYTSWNDNEYILFLIIVILFFIIIDFKLIKRKSAFTDTPSIPTTLPATTLPSTTLPATTLPATTLPATTLPATTLPYQAPTATNPSNNLFITEEEKTKWRRAWGQLDGNEETLPYMSNTLLPNTPVLGNTLLPNTLVLGNTAVKNDILQLDSSLYTPNFPSSNIAANIANYAQPGNWATIDDLGKSMTDTLGGINSNLGYTLLTEQLGTFKPNYNNPNVYDNTQNYKTGLNHETLSGVNTQGAGGNYKQVGKSPIFMQKDFAGVANIFAPNIYVSNAPLSDSGMPDISFTNGDGNMYTV
jgi:hypothetical protein